MNVRRKLYKGENDILECLDREEEYRELFLGGCLGIGLRERSDGKHIVMDILCEDDGHWFVDRGGWSSFWINDLQLVLQEVQEWLKNNADPDIPTNSGWPNGVPCGWRFR